ncbi:MAG: HAD-IC family P-type ATPase [Chlorobi bacterium]|nr:HAD-IC family P-type ATPase [Chlorobiota bacterium]
MSVACYHCGEDCGKHPVMWDEKPFCCEGCKTVYDILKENKLYTYYEMDNAPGIKVNEVNYGNKYAYLDNSEIIHSLLDFTEGEYSRITFFIPSIHCSSCIWLLENLHRFKNGIVHSNVNFVKKEVYITFKQDEISLRKLVELLVSISYVPQITLDSAKRKDKKSSSKQLIYKLGIAGFAFGNIMLLSFPEYFSGKYLIESHYRVFFSWLNLILALPVVFYSSSDYFSSAFKNLFHGIVNIDLPVSIGIITIFLRSSYEIISQTGAGYMDSLTGLVFFLLIGKWYQNKTYQALSFNRDYKSYFPIAVTRLNNNNEESIPLDKINTGDILIVRNKELIPADSTLVKGQGNIDYSFVTGESTPVEKSTGESILAGGRQIGSLIQLKVNKKVEQSYLTQLWNQDVTSTKTMKSITTFIDKVSKYFTIIIILIATITGVYWLFINPGMAMNAFTSVLIIACPCALALTIPFTFGSTMRVFGKNEFYIRKTDVIEKLTKIDTIVFDKTGTITQTGKVNIHFEGEKLTNEEIKLIKSVTRHSSHPLSNNLFNYLPGNDFFEVTRFEEIPARGIKAKINGSEIKIGSEEFVSNKKNNSSQLSTNVFISINNNTKGFFKIENKYRKNLNVLVSKLRTVFSVHLLSGDNEAEREKLLPIFKDKGKIHFNQSPTDKLKYVNKLKEFGKKVLMIGDGLNDAGALNVSDVGISIADDVYHFTPASDAILKGEKFGDLYQFIKFTKSSLSIVYISLGISFLYNFVGIFFAVQGYLTPIVSAILMPLSSVSVVAFVTFSVLVSARLKKL